MNKVKNEVEPNNPALRVGAVSKSLPDHYAGQLNTARIKTYRLLHEQYNLEEGTVETSSAKGQIGIRSSVRRAMFANIGI